MVETLQEPYWEQVVVEYTQEHWCLEEDLVATMGWWGEKGMPEAKTQKPKKETMN